jgi:hypothetical protein
VTVTVTKVARDRDRHPGLQSIDRIYRVFTG